MAVSSEYLRKVVVLVRGAGAVIGVQGVEERAKHTALRGSCVGGE